jgi:hypothetical protein
MGDDQRAIDSLVARFFTAFTNRHGRADVASARDLLIPEAVIVKNVGSTPEICGVETFLGPREELLSNGSLRDFEEAETSSRTDIHGNVAQRLSLYRKSGVLSGQRFETRGVKTFQFVRTPVGWRISAVAWDDERAGLTIPDRLPGR